MGKLCENENSTKYWSSRQEDYVAKFLNARTQPGSGAGKFKKSDIDAGTFLVECKTATTEKSQFSIKLEWLDKLKHEALMNHKHNFALAFNFGARANENYFILDEATFLNMKMVYDEYLEKQ